jgi:trimeric autotransporter adhesin
MSTKTTNKRIALVAVAALGMGLLSMVPASANRTLAGISNVNSITVTTNRAPVAGTTGNSAVHTLTFQTDSLTGSVVINPVIRLISKPALSAVADARTAYNAGAALTAGQWSVSSTAPTQTASEAAAFDVDGGTAADVSGANMTINTANAAGFLAGSLFMHARYDLAGTYVWSVFDDSDANGRVSAGDFSTTFTVVVGGSSSTTAVTATINTVNANAAVAGADGSLVRISLKDAAGNAYSPDQTAGVTLAVSGSAKIAKLNGNAVSGTPSTFTLGAGDFDGTGTAYVNVTNAVAETVSTTVTGTGFNGFTAPASIAITFRTITATATETLVTGLALATNPRRVSATSYQYDGTARTLSFKTNTAAATYDRISVTDASGAITGRVNAVYDLAVLGATTGTNVGTFSIVLGRATLTSTTFTVNGGSTVTIARAAAATGAVTVLSADTRLSATGATHSFLVEVDDQYGNPLANQTVTVAIAGRNSAQVLSNLVSDASGLVTFTYTDASTSTTSLTDTITFTQGSFSDTASVTYTTAANLGAATVLVVTPNTTALGVTEQVATATDIAAGAAGPTGSLASVTATVTNAAGLAVAGVPVTWTISGTGAAVRSTSATTYTNATGVATASVYGWIAGTYTVTATAGTVSDTAPINFSQQTPEEARTITATANGNIVTATVKDRFGNGVLGAPVFATRTGTGNFAGSSRANGTTDANGQIEFIVSGGDAEVTVSVGTTADYGQTDALAGLVSSITATDIFTASVAGTALVGEVGVGASFSAAGNNSAKASASVTDTAQVAADAAAEATDAANAATDAANAAAEAADAATAAAQDAADAVAALSTQVTELVSALRKQITSLTNLVIKIQRKVRA